MHTLTMSQVPAARSEATCGTSLHEVRQPMRRRTSFTRRSVEAAAVRLPSDTVPAPRFADKRRTGDGMLRRCRDQRQRGNQQCRAATQQVRPVVDMPQLSLRVLLVQQRRLGSGGNGAGCRGQHLARARPGRAVPWSPTTLLLEGATEGAHGSTTPRRRH